MARVAYLLCLLIASAVWPAVILGQSPRGVPRLSLPDSPQERPQVAEPSFTVEVTRVEVSVLVLDAEGKPVTGLTAADFDVLGEGVLPEPMPSAQGTGRVNAGSGSLRLMNDVLAAAAAGNVAIYPLNPNGLDVPDADIIQVSGLQGGVTMEDYNAILMEARQSREMGRDLAVLTGGVSLVDTNDPLGGIDRAMQDASTHYVLSYEPATPIKGSEFRRIDVKVKRPGVRVLARRGYRAASVRPVPPLKVPGSLSPHLRTLLAGIVPDDGLPMRVEAVPVARSGRDTTMAVILEIDGTRLADRPLDEALEIEQGLLTVNESGRAANGVRRMFTLRPSEAQWAVLAASGLRTVWAVDLPPGRHQLRVGAIHTRSGRGGSVYLDVVVPKAPDWPNGVLVAARFLSMMPTPFIDPRLTRWTDIAPTTTRVFPRGDVLTVTVPHDSARGAAQARLVRADGRTAWEGDGLPLDGTTAVRFVVPLADAEGISALVVDTSHGTQRLPVGAVAPQPAADVR